MPLHWLWNEQPLGDLWIQVPDMLKAWVGAENASPKGDPVETAWHNIARGIKSLCKPLSLREQPATVSLGLNEMSSLLLGNWKWNVTVRKYEMWDFFPCKNTFQQRHFHSRSIKTSQEEKKKKYNNHNIIANNSYFLNFPVILTASYLLK